MTTEQQVWLRAYLAYASEELNIKQTAIYADSVLGVFKDRFPTPQKEVVKVEGGLFNPITGSVEYKTLYEKEPTVAINDNDKILTNLGVMTVAEYKKHLEQKQCDDDYSAFQKAWVDYSSQDNEGYQPNRRDFKAGWFAALRYVRGEK